MRPQPLLRERWLHPEARGRGGMLLGRPVRVGNLHRRGLRQLVRDGYAGLPGVGSHGLSALGQLSVELRQPLRTGRWLHRVVHEAR